MRKSLAVIVLALATTSLACGDSEAGRADSADNAADAQASAPQTATVDTPASGGEFMGEPTSHWVEQIASGEDAGSRTRAMAALASIGPGDEGVTEALIGALADDEMIVKTGANQTLIKFGPAIAPQLVATLQESADPRIRAGVAPILGNWAGDATINAALCETLRNDSDVTVRTAAARGLTVGGAEAAAAVPSLIESLQEEESPEVLQFVALALGRMGPAAAEAIPALEAAEQDENRMVSNAARSSLRQIRQ